jgi:aspartate ammonia-lyase
MSGNLNMTRLESDLLGSVQVPSDALYGAQTQRAILNFPVEGHKTVGAYPSLIRGLMAVKEAAARVNRDNGFLPKEKADAIVKAARLVMRERLFDQFPIHCLHGGGGTSANMNANEVLANLAEEILGGKRGGYRLVHPNDHVNLHQSTNDVYPTACHIAIISKWPQLCDAVQRLKETLLERAHELEAEVRLSRTCLQDAVEVSFGDLLRGYVQFIDRSCQRMDAAVDDLHSVNLGGTIIGRKSDVPRAYYEQIVPALIEVVRDPRYRRAVNLFDAAQNIDDMAAVASQLDLFARVLIKMAKDFRLMGSGPEAGLGEIILPAVQAGSSIMPGKVNPVIPEFLIQVCFQVMGANRACQAALEHGELDLNVWESTAVFNILDAIELLTTALRVFESRCVQGFEVNSARNRHHVNSIVPLLTRLAHKHSYSRITAICKEAKGDLTRLRELLSQEGLLDGEHDTHPGGLYRQEQV